MSYLENARKRTARRRSPWNILMFGIVIVMQVVLVLAGFAVIDQVHRLVYPGQRLVGSEGKATILATLPIGFLALLGALPLANLLVRCVPPARQALDREAQPFPSASYRSSQRQLLRLLLWVAPALLLLSLVGAVLPWHR